MYLTPNMVNNPSRNIHDQPTGNHQIILLLLIYMMKYKNIPSINSMRPVEKPAFIV